MSEISSVVDEENEVLFEEESVSSSEESSMKYWSSLTLSLPEDNVKRILQAEGLYNPGSGELCDTYIAMSDSSIFKHPYYNYPVVDDPGILEALQEPIDEIVYPDDGQALYLAICKEMNQCPIRIFHRNLLDDAIDLRYYCINPNGVRAMAIALRSNKTVKTLNMIDSFLNFDACYHLGQMFKSNCFLYELNLSGCKIGSGGARRLFAGLPDNKTLLILNLNKNNLGDSGGELLAQSVSEGISVQELYLSSNNLGSKTAIALAESFEIHNNLTRLDLSWNNFYTPPSTFALLSRLSENNDLEELDLSYNSMNGPRIGLAIAKILSAINLRHLNLSNNKIQGECVTNFLQALHKPTKLISLNLSSNPLTPGDAVAVITKVTRPLVKLQELIMENISVNIQFLSVLEEVKKSMQSSKDFVVTYGDIVESFKSKGPDMRDVLLNRVQFLTKKIKKYSVDIAVVVLQLLKDNNFIMDAKNFSAAIRNSGALLDNDLLNELVLTFPGPSKLKTKTIDVALLGDFIQRKWPDRKLPQTPPQ